MLLRRPSKIQLVANIIVLLALFEVERRLLQIFLHWLEYFSQELAFVVKAWSPSVTSYREIRCLLVVTIELTQKILDRSDELANLRASQSLCYIGASHRCHFFQLRCKTDHD